MKRHTKRILICIYFILLGCVFFNSAFSRYSSSVNGKIEMDVANIKLNLVTTVTNLENVSNTEQNIAFTVNNYDGNASSPIINETEYQYQIEITKNNASIPLQYELYKVQSGTQTQVTLTNGKSTNFTMKASVVQEDSFILKVKMDNKDYKNLSDYININVYAVQVEDK